MNYLAAQKHTMAESLDQTKPIQTRNISPRTPSDKMMGISDDKTYGATKNL